ncbi:phosphonate ABC transporter, permease protein PhnE [Flexivirga caeni]|uniref:Phosphonate ABC transporter, permease protein PhnE n=1 Tax=Flexivirga caeni TaxID=2294115 RepID=A0A3M9M0E3_9MICO|nr:phosphonate ABC transporter, permease protein PhnE [Flexivirga caeni]RNI18068.1 phosphonate ABC transporter, permease protein PhnE [Flexivirga caeni]
MSDVPAQPAQPRAARPPRPRRGATPWVIGIVLAAITVWAARGVQIDIPAIWQNFSNASGTLMQLFQPDYGFFPQTLSAIEETLMMAVIATAIGSLGSVPLAFLASRATNPSRALLAAIRFLNNVIRAVPDLLYAAVFVAVVGTGALSGVLALFFFNIGILVKLVSESLDGLDRGPQEAALAAGGTWFAADRVSMLPSVAPSFASQVLYTFEVNIRASTVIGLVGAGGLGVLIDNVRTFYHYHYLSLIILEILVLVLVVETASSMLRKQLAR